MLDINNNPNFNIQFPNSKSDVLIHLAQWQYWWWFWFSSFWGMYYLFLSKTLKNRVLKFKPKIATSFRPHGKWGDLIICLIPVSWCFNILVNSNFLLKLLEWQAESSLFTIRIRGRQWYWVYKFDLKSVTDIISAPKNIGNNRWSYTFAGETTKCDNYTHLIQMRAQRKWVKSYYKTLSTKLSEEKKSNFNFNSEFNFFETIKNKNIVKFKLNKNGMDVINFKNNSLLLIKSSKNKFFKKKPFLNFFNNNTNYISKNFVYSDETTRDVRNPIGKKIPVDLIKKQVLKNNLNKNFLFKFRFNDSNVNTNHRVSTAPQTFCFKQKRYKRRNSITPIQIDYKNKIKNNLKFNSFLNLKENYKLETSTGAKKKLTTMHRLVRKARVRNDNMNVTVSKRLLRVKRTLVIPTHVNITAITNSYDVVHSWFIPGLGLKMDCVPGRSTHHTFYVDNAGFYYGQCAEICGRYHHHMPIRVCALPFEHFLLWWNTFGLPKLMKNKNRNIRKEYSFRKFVW